MNPLYPVFFKLDKLQLLIVGAGVVGHEKLSFMLKSSPNANITVIADWISPAVEALAKQYPLQLNFIKKLFEPTDVVGFNLIVAATNIPTVNKAVHHAAKAAGILVNVADTPDLCDFYLGAIVTKGNLKIAISTNGKSPTFAKRLRQLLENSLSDDVNTTLELLQEFRNRLGTDCDEKVRKLNALTETLLSEKDDAQFN